MPVYWPSVPQRQGSAPGTSAGGTFLGKGLRSPLREDPVTGDFQRVSDDDNVEQCLRDGILTMLGERVMAEGLGTVTREMIFENSTVVSDLVPPSIRDFIEGFEPRVLLTDCRCSPRTASDTETEFVITVSYRIRATNSPKNLTFPFYLRAEV